MAKSLKEKLSGSDSDSDGEPIEGDNPETETFNEETGEFRAAQVAKAAEQNMTQPNAVPEQRPQAFLEPPAPHSDLTQRLIDEGEISNEPMGPEAYEKAASDSQMQTAADESRTPQLHPGLTVKVTEGPHRDRIVAITRVVSYKDDGDLARVTAGGPEARFVQPQEVEGRAIGDDRDGEMLILDVVEAGLEVLRDFRSLARR